MQYYYLIASLPYLYHDKPAPLSGKEFLNTCKLQLKKADFECLQTARMYAENIEGIQLKVLSDWNSWDRGLRNELVQVRIENSGGDPQAFIRKDGWVRSQAQMTLAKNAISAASPLFGEKMLNLARWKFLDGLESGNNFNLQLLVIYYLKLQLLEKMSLVNPEMGMNKLMNILDRSDEKTLVKFEENV